MTSARHRCFSLLMAKDQFTSPMTSHYDTPGNFDKNPPGLSPYARPLDSVPSNPIVKLQHMANKFQKKFTHRKSNTYKLNNPNAEKIVIKHIITNLAINIHIFNQSPLIMLK